MNPLKQGLKHAVLTAAIEEGMVFIHESIKTRVETLENLSLNLLNMKSLSMNPLKQGLKPYQV